MLDRAGVEVAGHDHRAVASGGVRPPEELPCLHHPQVEICGQMRVEDGEDPIAAGVAQPRLVEHPQLPELAEVGASPAPGRSPQRRDDAPELAGEQIARPPVEHLEALRDEQGVALTGPLDVDDAEPPVRGGVL